MRSSRSDKIRVGIFVVVAGAVLAGGLLWLAGSRFLRPVDNYTVLFDESVSGLASGANVEYQGVVVGRVRDVTLTRDIPPKVAVVIDVNPGTPIRRDTIAALLGSLVTGIKFIQLQGGTEGAGALPPGEYLDGDVTSLEQFRDQIAEIADRATSILRRLDEDVFTPEVSGKFARFIDDLAGVASSLNTTLQAFRAEETGREFASLVERLSSAADKANAVLGDFYERRESIYGNLESTLRHLDEVIVDARGLVQSATQQVGGASNNFGSLIGELGATTNRLQETLDVIRSDPSILLWGRSVPEREFPVDEREFPKDGQSE